jgi:hypothetical protein
MREAPRAVFTGEHRHGFNERRNDERYTLNVKQEVLSFSTHRSAVLETISVGICGAERKETTG